MMKQFTAMAIAILVYPLICILSAPFPTYYFSLGNNIILFGGNFFKTLFKTKKLEKQIVVRSLLG